jgi:hypothetical protein
MKKTLKIKIITDDFQHRALLGTMNMFNQIQNEISSLAFEQQEYRKYHVHQIVYRIMKEKWKKIKENLPEFVENLVTNQHAEMFSYCGDRATVMLNRVIHPLVEQHRINLVATKTQMSTQMSILEHWTAERLTEIMTSCFIE